MSSTYSPNHPEWTAFTRAMRTSRGDDTPRLVFCDWLDERYGLGNPLACLIRAQVEYNQVMTSNSLGPSGWDFRFNPGCHEYTLQQNCLVLLRRTWLAWPCCKNLEPHVLAQWRWHRGFPERIVLPWDHWLRHWATITAVGPVGEVFICDGPEMGTLQYPETQMVGCHIPDLWTIKRDHQILLTREAFFTNPRGTRINVCEKILRQVWPEDQEVESIQIDEGLNDLRLPDEPVIAAGPRSP